MKELAIELHRIGNGERVTAVYLPHEERAMLRHIAEAEKRGVPREVVEREIEFLHLVKAEFGAVLIP